MTPLLHQLVAKELPALARLAGVMLVCILAAGAGGCAQGAEKSTAEWRDPATPFPEAKWLVNGKLKYTTTWMGNSYGGPEWVQKDGMGMGVGPDGACFMPAAWDEDGKGIGIYKDGKATGLVPGISSSQGAAAVGERYAYVALSKNGLNGLGRVNLDGSPAAWPGSDNFVPIGKGWQAGAALGKEVLYATDRAENTIHVIDLNTKKEKLRFPCEKPWRMTVDKEGNLWVISGQDEWPLLFVNHPKIIQYAPDGKPTGKAITADVDGANALAVDGKGRLLVAGPHHQVVKYDISKATPVVVDALGVKEGIYAGATPGRMGADRLAFLWGVGVDAQDDIYTFSRYPSGGGGADLRKYSPAGKLQWWLVSTQFMDLADVDPASEQGDKLDIYTRDEHFALDLSKGPGREWTWKGYTVDPKYDDGRVDSKYDYCGMSALATPRVVRLEGRLYLYLFSAKPFMCIYRQGPGEVLLPSSIIDFMRYFQRYSLPGEPHFIKWPVVQPKESRWVWRDTNGDGMIQSAEYETDPLILYMDNTLCVDSKGDLWIKGFDEKNWQAMWHWPLAGFDKALNPIYHPKEMKRIPFPPELKDCGGLEYDAPADVMYAAGKTKEHPETHGGLGSEIIRYDHWSKPEERKVHCRMVLPHSKNEDEDLRGMAVAGGRVFCNRRYKGLVFVYDADTGEKLGEMSAGPEVHGEHGWPDIDYSLRAYERKNGETLLFIEDDWKSKIILYRLLPKQAVQSDTSGQK